MTQKLFIIGNGFDLAHGIPSRYKNFVDYIKEDGFSWEDIETYICTYEPALWASFEDLLNEFDEDTLKEDTDWALEGYGAEDWSDSNHHKYQYEIEKKIDEFIDNLQDDLKEWVSTLIQYIKEQNISKIIKSFSRADLFITFNYTNTLEKIYNIPREKILYIHGNGMNKKENLIIGHGSDPKTDKNKQRITEFEAENRWHEEATANPDKLEYQENPYEKDPRVREADGIISTYYERSFKNTAEIIKSNSAFFDSLTDIQEIYILGHSLSDIDMLYFREIKQKAAPKAHWNVSYYGIEEKEEKRQKMLALGISENCLTLKPIEDF